MLSGLGALRSVEHPGCNGPKRNKREQLAPPSESQTPTYQGLVSFKLSVVGVVVKGFRKGSIAVAVRIPIRVSTSVAVQLLDTVYVWGRDPWKHHEVSSPQMTPAFGSQPQELVQQANLGSYTAPETCL